MTDKSIPVVAAQKIRELLSQVGELLVCVAELEEENDKLQQQADDSYNDYSDIVYLLARNQTLEKENEELLDELTQERRDNKLQMEMSENNLQKMISVISMNDIRIYKELPSLLEEGKFVQAVKTLRDRMTEFYFDPGLKICYNVMKAHPAYHGLSSRQEAF